MTSDAEDRSTWPRNGQVIRRDELLRLIEENGGPEGLDLRGAVFLGDGARNNPFDNPIDLRPEALGPLAEQHRESHCGSSPRWLGGEGGITLGRAHLQSTFIGGALLERAYLAEAQFDDADLTEAQLHAAVLGSAQLRGADLTSANLCDAGLVCADLEGAQLNYAQAQGAVLEGADLHGANLWGADFRAANLQDANLHEADLTDANLEGVNLAGSQLQDAEMHQTRLERANLRGARLQQADLYGVSSLDGARWCGALLDHTRIRRQSLGKAIGDERIADGTERRKPWEWYEEGKVEAYDSAKEAYLLLKNNFNWIGRYEDASWAYVKERCMERKALYQEHRWWIWPPKRWVPKSWKSWWRWVLAWATEALTNYGQDPWRPIVWAVALALGLFPLLFWTAGNLHHQDGTSITAYWDAMAYSLTTFGTLSFNDLQPVGIGTRIISAIEAFTGVLLFALVVFTLGNKMSRG